MSCQKMSTNIKIKRKNKYHPYIKVKYIIYCVGHFEIKST